MQDLPIFLDDNVESGKTYYYRVAMVDAEWREGPLCAPVTAELDTAAVIAAGPKSMTLSLPEQRIYFYEGGQLVNILRCSTGLYNATPTGYFRILNHLGTHAGVGGAVCDYWMSFTPKHGIHAWPKTSKGYEQGLGAPASHGCVRLHPLEAYWPYFWAPDGTPFTIIGYRISNYVVSGCHDTIGSPILSRDWYFAEGFTAGAFETYILMSNPSDSSVYADVDFFLEGGGKVTQGVWMSPHSRYTLGVDALPQLAWNAFSTHIHANAPIVAERAMYFVYSGKPDGSVTVGSSQLSRDWYFAEGYTGGEFDTYFTLANIGDTGTNVTMTFMLEDGSNIIHNCWVAPFSRYTVGVDGIPGLANAAFATWLHAESAPIVAERSVYFRKLYIKGGHASIGSTTLSDWWFFAEGCTRPFFQSYLVLGNPDDTAAVVDVVFYLQETCLMYSYRISPHARLTLDVNTLPYLNGRDIGFAIHANRPIVAERAIYYDLDSHRGGSASIGSVTPSNTWYFAEGYTGDAFDTYLCIANTDVNIANVQVRFQRTDGAVFDYYYQVTPQRRLTIGVDGLPGLGSASFSATITSDVPIVAEREMYFVFAR